MVAKSVDVPTLEKYQRNQSISQQVSEGHPEEELDPDEDGMDGYEADIEDNLDDEEAGPDLEEQRNGVNEIVAVQNFDEISNHIVDGHSEVDLDSDKEEGTDGYEADMEEEAGLDLEEQRNGANEIVPVQNVDEISNHIFDGRSEVELDPNEEEGTDGDVTNMEEEAGPDLEGQRNVLQESDDGLEHEMDDGVFDGVDYGGEIQFLVAMVETFPAAVDEL